LKRAPSAALRRRVGWPHTGALGREMTRRVEARSPAPAALRRGLPGRKPTSC
jgi:hypothetical protein